jgi:hypothetical protein
MPTVGVKAAPSGFVRGVEIARLLGVSKQRVQAHVGARLP